MTGPEPRRSPRAVVELECTLARRRGNPIHAVTRDLGAGGMRVVTDRPLGVDEELEFDLVPGGPGSRHGRARVVREQSSHCYALSFETMLDDILDWVHLVKETA
jgi:hypothetical protein